MQLTVEGPEEAALMPRKHPLASASQDRRNDSRRQVLGVVLAAIAGRRQAADRNQYDQSSKG